MLTIINKTLHSWVSKTSESAQIFTKCCQQIKYISAILVLYLFQFRQFVPHTHTQFCLLNSTSFVMSVGMMSNESSGQNQHAYKQDENRTEQNTGSPCLISNPANAPYTHRSNMDYDDLVESLWKIYSSEQETVVQWSRTWTNKYKMNLLIQKMFCYSIWLPHEEHI